jgi:hypothetical protein
MQPREKQVFELHGMCSPGAVLHGRLFVDHVVVVTDHAGRFVLSLTLGASVLSSAGARYDHAASVIRGDGPSSNMNASSESATDTSRFQSWMVTAPARNSTSPRVLSSFKVRLT